MNNSPWFKYGAHQFLWQEHWTDDGLAVLDSARELGLDLFEVALGDDVEFDLDRTRRYAESLGIELTVGPGCAWPLECNISSDNAKHRALGLDWHKANIERTAELGAVAYCGAIYSHPGHVIRRPPSEAEMPTTAENLHILAEYAQARGVVVVIEPMSRFRVHLVNTAAQALELVQLADHENLKINLDTFHMVTEERNYGQAICSVLPKLWGIHACENDRGIPGGGIVPWSTVFNSLAGASGCIRLMLETYNTGPSHFGYFRGIFSNLCPDPKVFVRDGITFLKSQVNHLALGD